MRKVALVSAAVLAVSAAAVSVWVATRSDSDSAAESKPPPPTRGASAHGEHMDDAYASVLAMYDAPEGGTPCETALNAFAAEASKARSLRRESHFAFVADRGEFIAGCEQLAAQAQRCLAPYYQARHRDDCAEALPAHLSLSHLFKERPQPEGGDVLAEDPLVPDEH